MESDGSARHVLPTSLLMSLCHRAAEDRVFEELSAAGFEDLTRAQGRLLAGIDLEGTRLQVLARRARIAKQTATILVDRLEASGYVERTPDPEDGRARRVRLTDRGRSMLPHAVRAEQAVEAEWEALLGVRRLAMLRSALAALATASDPELALQ